MSRELDLKVAEAIGYSFVGQFEEWGQNEAGEYYPLEITDDNWIGSPPHGAPNNWYEDIRGADYSSYGPIPYFSKNWDDALAAAHIFGMSDRKSLPKDPLALSNAIVALWESEQSVPSDGG